MTLKSRIERMEARAGVGVCFPMITELQRAAVERRLLYLLDNADEMAAVLTRQGAGIQALKSFLSRVGDTWR